MKDFIKQLDSYSSLKNAEKELVKGIFKAYESVDKFVYPKVDGFPTIDDKHKRRIVDESKVALKEYLVNVANDYIKSLKKEDEDV